MAKQLSKTGIASLGTIRPGHVSQSVDAFTGIEAYDIFLSGSFNMTGSINGEPGIENQLTASYSTTSSYSVSSTSASYATNSTTSSYSQTASYSGDAISASYALTSSYAENAISASYALSSSFAFGLQGTGSYIPVWSGTSSSISNTLQRSSLFQDTNGNILVGQIGTVNSKLYIQQNSGSGVGLQLVAPGAVGVNVTSIAITNNGTGNFLSFTSASKNVLSLSNLGNAILTGSISVLGSTALNIQGNIISTGSLNVSGSTSFIGTHTLSGSNTITGTTILSGSIEVSGSSNFHNSIFIVTGSQFYTGSSHFIGSQDITGSLKITGSVEGSGFYVDGNKQFNYASYANTSSISGSANVSHSFSYDSPDGSAGISLVSGSRITFSHSGVYNIQFSAQLYTQTGATIHIWFKETGSNIPESGTRVGPTANGDYLAPAWNFVKHFPSGSYVELVWQSDQDNTQFPYIAATGNIPSCPAIILTVTQVR